MKKSYSLTVSVLRAEADAHRAILWDNIPVRQSDKISYTVTVYGKNLFVVLRYLKESVLHLAERQKIEFVQGIHNSAPCWPINPLIQCEDAFSWTDSLVGIGRFLSLCPVRLPEGRLAAHLYASTPHFLPSGVEKAGFPLGQLGQNLFLVADTLFRRGLEALDSQKLEHVSGIHDQEACWPEGF